MDWYLDVVGRLPWWWWGAGVVVTVAGLIRLFTGSKGPWWVRTSVFGLSILVMAGFVMIAKELL